MALQEFVSSPKMNEKLSKLQELFYDWPSSAATPQENVDSLMKMLFDIFPHVLRDVTAVEDVDTDITEYKKWVDAYVKSTKSLIEAFHEAFFLGRLWLKGDARYKATDVVKKFQDIQSSKVGLMAGFEGKDPRTVSGVVSADHEYLNAVVEDAEWVRSTTCALFHLVFMKIKEHARLVEGIREEVKPTGEANADF